MLLSPRAVSAGCIYASIHVLGVLSASPLASLFLMLFSPRGVSAACIYALIHILCVLSAYLLASVFQMLFSPRIVSAACIYASIYALGVLFTYRFASLFQMLFSPCGVSAACIYASIYVFGVLSTYRLTAARKPEPPKASASGRLHRKASSSSSKQRYCNSFLWIWVSSVLCMQVPFRIPSYRLGFMAGRGTPFDRIPRPHRYAHTDIKFV
jgi:hypothetical protein